jgi:hypothetical protein
LVETQNQHRSKLTVHCEEPRTGIMDERHKSNSMERCCNCGVRRCQSCAEKYAFNAFNYPGEKKPVTVNRVQKRFKTQATSSKVRQTKRLKSIRYYFKNETELLAAGRKVDFRGCVVTTKNDEQKRIAQLVLSGLK